MHGIIYYRNRHGKSPIADYLRELDSRKDKKSCILLTKIYDYIDYLREAGKSAGEPYIKHLDGEIWELRPVKERVLFAAWDGNMFILLHHFTKKTRKTPQKEIDRAKRNLADYRERSGNDEKG